MAKVTIRGKEYELRLDLNTMERLEEAFEGDSAKAARAMTDRSFRNLRRLFVAMANSAKEYREQEPDVTEKTLDHISLKEITEVTDAIVAAQEEGFKADTANGAADDERHDAVLEAMEAEEEKNGETGEG